MQRDRLYSGWPLSDFGGLGSFENQKIAVLGPNNSFSGTVQDQLLVDSLCAAYTPYIA